MSARSSGKITNDHGDARIAIGATSMRNPLTRVVTVDVTAGGGTGAGEGIAIGVEGGGVGDCVGVGEDGPHCVKNKGASAAVTTAR